jgi:hypothetical protein
MSRRYVSLPRGITGETGGRLARTRLFAGLLGVVRVTVTMTGTVPPTLTLVTLKALR